VYNLKHRILLDKKTTKFFSVFVKQNATICKFSNSESWVILSDIEQRIKEKIDRIGTPLKDWNIQINYGIKTGFNDAFIINGAKRKELIDADPKSEEIIRPILRGRDIKRYSYEFADLYLITTFPSLKIDIEEYPAVKAHLLSFGYDRLKQTGEKGARKKTNNKWFETQDSIAYWEDFNRHKSAWASVGETFYSCVDPGLFLLDTNYFFSADSPEYLLGILNSKLITYWINSEDTPIGSGGAYRHYKYNLERLPIPRNEKSVIVKLVKKLLDKIDKNVLREIDLIVYSLYGLTEIEIDFIENMNI
jgi:adenine-specific DNA-methyltransferase